MIGWGNRNALLLTSGSVFLDELCPLIALGVLVKYEIGGPGALDYVLGPASLCDDLVSETTCLGQHEEVERVAEVVVVDDGVGEWVG